MKLRRGFTLIEVVVAVAVLAMGCTALFGLLSRSLYNLKKVEDIHRYQLAGEDLMTRVLYLPAFPAGGQVEGTIDTLGAQWKVVVFPWFPKTLDGKPGQAIMKVDVEVLWSGRSGPRNIRLEAVKPATIRYETYDFGEAIEKVFPR